MNTSVVTRRGQFRWDKKKQQQRRMENVFTCVYGVKMTWNWEWAQYCCHIATIHEWKLRMQLLNFCLQCTQVLLLWIYGVFFVNCWVVAENILILRYSLSVERRSNKIHRNFNKMSQTIIQWKRNLNEKIEENSHVAFPYSLFVCDSFKIKTMMRIQFTADNR